jgi:cell division protein FtsL
MGKKAHLPQMTDCFAPVPRTVSLSESKMVQAVFICVVLAGLALAHVHLQFVTRDLRMQHRKVQEKHQALMQQQSRLQHDIEAECDSSKLRAFGRDADMIEPDMRVQAVAAVPSKLVDKYLGVSEQSQATVVAHAISGDDGHGDLTVRQILYTLADVNKAFAGQARQ